jgi:PAS domain S-box-containing protein
MLRLMRAIPMHSGWKSFGLAGAIMAGALALRTLLNIVLPDSPPFITLYPAVAVAALFCGPAAASAAGLSGAVAAFYLWAAPRMSLSVASATDRASIFLFVCGSAVVIWACAELRARLEAVSAARDEQIRIQSELRREREWLRLALEAGALAVWDYDARTGEAEIDTRYATTLGYGPGSRIMSRRQLGSHIHPEDQARVAAEHDALVASGSPYQIEYRVITGAGEVRWVVSQGIFVGGDAAGPQRIAGIIQDITERKRREEGLRELAAARELLVREADHRIKNSLQLVMSLLSVQLRGVREPAAAEALREASARVSAIAASHLALQGSADLKTLDVAVTLRELCAHFGQLQPAVTVACRFEGELTLDADRAIPLGLAVSEVLTNALRHAFTGRDGGNVVVEAGRAEGELCVRIRDDGVGMAEGGGGGLGSRIMRALAAQLAAKIEVESRAGEGTVVTLRLQVAP